MSINQKVQFAKKIRRKKRLLTEQRQMISRAISLSKRPRKVAPLRWGQKLINS